MRREPWLVTHPSLGRIRRPILGSSRGRPGLPSGMCPNRPTWTNCAGFAADLAVAASALTDQSPARFSWKQGCGAARDSPKT